eukprot:29471-Pelagococcus_subviridis.AAC.4
MEAAEAAARAFLAPDETGARSRAPLASRRASRVARARASPRISRDPFVSNASPSSSPRRRHVVSRLPSSRPPPNLLRARRRGVPLQEPHGSHAHRDPVRGRAREPARGADARGVRRRRQREDGDLDAGGGELRAAEGARGGELRRVRGRRAPVGSGREVRHAALPEDPHVAREGRAGAPSQPRKTPPLDAESEALIDAVYAECVGRFHMLRCHGSLDFLKALTVVERAFVEAEAERERRDAADASADDAADASAARTRARAQTQTRRLLLIDNIAAFYWLDRASRREQGAPLSLHAVHHAFAAKLLALRRVLCISHWSPYDRVRVVNADP